MHSHPMVRPWRAPVALALALAPALTVARRGAAAVRVAALARVAVPPLLDLLGACTARELTALPWLNTAAKVLCPNPTTDMLLDTGRFTGSAAPTAFPDFLKQAFAESAASFATHAFCHPAVCGERGHEEPARAPSRRCSTAPGPRLPAVSALLARLLAPAFLSAARVVLALAHPTALPLDALALPVALAAALVRPALLTLALARPALRAPLPLRPAQRTVQLPVLPGAAFLERGALQPRRTWPRCWGPPPPRLAPAPRRPAPPRLLPAALHTLRRSPPGA